MATIQDIQKLRFNTKGICRLAKALGYDGSLGPTFSDGTSLGSLVEFFDDNPGACEAVLEWAQENCDLDDEEGDEDEDEDDGDEEGDE